MHDVGCRVWGVGCGVWGLGCEVRGVGYGVWGVGCLLLRNREHLTLQRPESCRL